MTTQCKKCNYEFNPLIALICTLTGLFGAVAIVGLLLDSFAVLCVGVSLFGVLTLGVFIWELVRASMSYHKYRTGNASDSKVKQVLIADICCSVVAILVAVAFVALALVLNLLSFDLAVQISVKSLLVVVVAYLIVVGAMFDYFAKYRKASSCETQTTAVVAESQPAVEEVKAEPAPVAEPVKEEKPVVEPVVEQTPVAEEKPTVEEQTTEPAVEEKPAEQPSVEPVEQKAEQPAPQAEPTAATTAPKKTTSTKSTSTASKPKSSSTSKSGTSKSKTTTPKE